MAGKVLIGSRIVWELFELNKSCLRNQLKSLAEDREKDIDIYLTEDTGFPQIVVMQNGRILESEIMVDEEDCASSVEKIYAKYLCKDYEVSEKEAKEEKAEEQETPDDTDDFSEEDIEEGMILDREDELDAALIDFLSVVFEEPASVTTTLLDDDPKEFEEIKETFLGYLAKMCKYDIRRPMYLEYPDGKVEFTEHPYDNMEVDVVVVSC